MNTRIVRLNPCFYSWLVLLLLGMAGIVNVHAQSFALSNLWSMASSPTSFLNTTNNNTRGIAYNPATGHLLAVSRTAQPTVTNAIYILDGDNGSVLGTLPFDSDLIKGGTFVMNMIGVTDDGVIYVGNLTTDATNTTATTGPFKLYRWANESALPTLAYSGDPSFTNKVYGAASAQRRFGDSLALRGTGADTQILLGTYHQLIGLLTTTDGENFTATPIVTDLAAEESRRCLAWGAGDTFWAKTIAGDLRQFTLNLGNNTASNTAAIPLPGVYGMALDVDVSKSLASIVTTNHTLRLYDILNPAAVSQQDTVKTFPAPAYANLNWVGAASLRSGRLYGLDVNNGILAYTLHEVYRAPSIITGPVSMNNLWEGADWWTFRVVAGGNRGDTLTYQWQFNGSDIENATDSSLTLSNVTPAMAGTYTVSVANSIDAVTASATLGVLLNNFSDQATGIWSLAPGSRPYLNTTYSEQAVAINPLTTNVIVVTKKVPTNMIAVLDIETGAHKHYIDYSSLTVDNMNKVTVADDGTIFVCNFTTDTAASPFRIYGFSDDNPTPGMTGFLYNEDPGAGTTPANVGWGANIDARGAGMDTEILIGSGRYNATPINTKVVAILRYNDTMSGFVSTPITVTNAPNSNNTFRFGLCWGPGNSFFVKGLTSLMLVEYDLASGTGWITKQYPTSGARSVPAGVAGIAYDDGRKLLAGLLNGSSPQPVSVNIYDVRDTEAGPFWADQELFSSYNADIEFNGTVSFERGYIVALGVNNGLKAMRVNDSFSGTRPAIVSQPGNLNVFEGTNPSLTVVADSLIPLSYQWYYYGTQAIAWATGPTITLTNVQASQAGEYMVRVSNTGGYRDTIPATVTVMPVYNTPQMTNIWSVMSLSRPYLNNTYSEYGMAFNPVNSNLVVASYVLANDAALVAVMDGLTGDHKHYLDLTTVTNGGNRTVNKVGVADDGVVYVCNRVSGSSSLTFVIYRWANDEPTTVATEAFKGNPFVLAATRNRGWTMDVRGAGVNTEILLSTSGTNVLSILTTTDGMNFTAKEIVVPGVAPSFARLGVCFGAGNTIWTKAYYADGNAMHLIQYDLEAGTGTVLRTYTDMPLVMTTLAYNDSLKFLAGMSRDEQKNVQLYSVADLDAGPMLLDQEVFPTYYPEIEANGALDFGGNTYLFSLDENNGIIAMLINQTYAPPAILSATTDGQTITITWPAVNGAKYQVQQKGSLDDGWNNLGQVITVNGTTGSYSETLGAGPRFYRVESVNQ
jgi:hypothetical protein